MNFMYSNQTQLSQLQPQQKQQPQQQPQQLSSQQNSKPMDQHLRSALTQSLSTLSAPGDNKLSTISHLTPSLVQGVSQAGQILNLGATNASLGGQILNLPNSNGAGGQNFYVMIPQQQLDANNQLQKIAPMGAIHQTASDSLAAQRSEREEKRRQTHNEVERRRRTKINGWIQKLAEMVPNCKDEMGTKRGPSQTGMGQKSNCGVLQKTVNFIQELQIAHSQVVERLQEQNQVLVEMAKIRETLKRVEQENQLLRNQLQNHGIEPVSTQNPVSRPNQ